MEDSHSFWNFHTCKLCWKYRSKSEFIMSKHVKLHQTKPEDEIFKCASNTPEPHECFHCGLDSDTKVNIHTHSRVFHKSNLVASNQQIIGKCFNYQCLKCEFQTYSLLVLTKHVYSRDHLNTEYGTDHFVTYINGFRWFNCKQCSFKAKFNYYMKRHILWKHTSVDKIPWTKCGQCSYKTKLKGSLTRHMRRKHPDEKNVVWFKCEHCPYKSKCKEYLKQHLGKHINVKDIKWFTCEHCPSKFKFKCSLKHHMLTKHIHS